MHARHKRFKLDPTRLAAAAEDFKQGQDLEDFRNQRGYKGITLIGDSKTGEAKLISRWERKDDADTGGVTALDRRASDQLHRNGGGTGEVSSDEWDVVVDDKP